MDGMGFACASFLRLLFCEQGSTWAFSREDDDDGDDEDDDGGGGEMCSTWLEQLVILPCTLYTTLLHQVYLLKKV